MLKYSTTCLECFGNLSFPSSFFQGQGPEFTMFYHMPRLCTCPLGHSSSAQILLSLQNLMATIRVPCALFSAPRGFYNSQHWTTSLTAFYPFACSLHWTMSGLRAQTCPCSSSVTQSDPVPVTKEMPTILMNEFLNTCWFSGERVQHLQP